MKKIGILYICTGVYDIFWKDFYLSAEKNLLSGEDFERHYFVFTDKEKVFDSDVNPNIHLIAQENLGWPYATLMRFHMFLAQKDLLSQMDYLYFLNANLEIKSQIFAKEFLPYGEGLVFVRHPWFFDVTVDEYPYERNVVSQAYIPFGEGKDYVQGALIGGSRSPFLEFCEDCKKNTDIDLSKDIIALWHDESHLNAYLYRLQEEGQDDKVRILTPSYLCPDNALIPFICKILIIDKARILNITKIKSLKKEPFKTTFLRRIGYFLFPLYQQFLKLKQSWSSNSKVL